MAGLWQESQTRQQHARHRKRRVRPPFLNPLKSYGGQPGRCRATTANERRFGLDDDEEQVHSGTFFGSWSKTDNFPGLRTTLTLPCNEICTTNTKCLTKRIDTKIALDKNECYQSSINAIEYRIHLYHFLNLILNLVKVMENKSSVYKWALKIFVQITQKSSTRKKMMPTRPLLFFPIIVTLQLLWLMPLE